MNNKTLLILLGIFIVLVGLIYVPDVLKPIIFKPEQLKLANWPIDTAEVDKINIKSGKEGIEMVRKEGAWHIGPMEADADQVTKLLNSVRDLELAEVMASSSSSHERMGVAEPETTLAEFTISGKPSRTLGIYIGNFLSQDQGSFYMRENGSDMVYLAKSELQSLAYADKAQWQSKTIVDLNGADLFRISWNDRGRSAILTLVNDSWTLSVNGRAVKASQERITNFLKSLSPLKADGFLHESEIVDYKKSGASLFVAYGKNSKVLHSFKLFRRDDNYGISPDRLPDVFYRIEKGRLEGLLNSDGLK